MPKKALKVAAKTKRKYVKQAKHTIQSHAAVAQPARVQRKRRRRRRTQEQIAADNAAAFAAQNAAGIAQGVVDSPALAPMIRTGQDGGCTLCHNSIASHMDPHGNWLGCFSTKGGTLMLVAVPAAHRVVSTSVIRRQQPHLIQQPRQPAELAQLQQPVPRAMRAPQIAQPAMPSIAQPAAAQPPYRVLSGPRVVYLALRAMNDPLVQGLSNADLGVYKLIRRRYKTGATRETLLQELNAQAHTGRVDGAVRRLRLMGAINVASIQPAYAV